MCWGENFATANEYKRSKYQQLVEDCQEKKCQANCIPIEIGCWGFMSESMCYALSSIGITGITKRKAIKAITHETEMAVDKKKRSKLVQEKMKEKNARNDIILKHFQ